MSAFSGPEYDWIEGVEEMSMYMPGGYHPVNLGDILHERYHIIDKLGHGGYSTVWLARDTQQEQYVAVKVCVADALPNEIKILKDLSASSSDHPGRNSVPRLLDEFTVDGPNGTHACYTMLPAQSNLLDISMDDLFTVEVARVLSARLVQALAYVHSEGYAHGDLHLNNVLVPLPERFHRLSLDDFRKEHREPETVPVVRCDGGPLPPNVPKEAVPPLFMGDIARNMAVSEARVVLSDFGEAYSPASGARLGKDCHTPLASRPPEAKFEPGTPLSYSADIWSLAIAIWDIIGMQALFSTNFVTEDDIIAEQVDTLKPQAMPSTWWESWEAKSQYFDAEGVAKEEREAHGLIEQEFEGRVQRFRRKLKVGEFDKDETAAIICLMRRMLGFQPEDRPTCDEVLQSAWMVGWALPELRRAEGVPEDEADLMWKDTGLRPSQRHSPSSASPRSSALPDSLSRHVATTSAFAGPDPLS